MMTGMAKMAPFKQPFRSDLLRKFWNTVAESFCFVQSSVGEKSSFDFMEESNSTLALRDIN